ncbi:MAG TPA: hypothetical protein PLH25_04725 [Flavobacterium sp.]|nr:hypothetical protein [Flavobacterium sp.]
MKFILILSLLLNSINAFSQEKDIDTYFFFLGTLSDYMGRQKCSIELDKVDNYYKFESSLMEYNYGFLKNKYPDLSIDRTLNILKSNKLASEINKNFKYEFNEGFCSDNTDQYGNLKDSIFVGKLKLGIFKTEKQKLSYIVGAYTRYGDTNDKNYCIRIANSISTFPICVKLLKQLGCKKVRTKVIKALPYNYVIYFEPSKDLEEFLLKYRFLIRKSDNSDLKSMPKN